MEEKNMRKLSPDEMAEVSGGTGKEWKAYIDKMKDKYGQYYLSQMTLEEYDRYDKWLRHKPGEPDPE